MTEKRQVYLLGSQAFSGERLSLPARGRNQVPFAAAVGSRPLGLGCSTLRLLLLTNLGRDVVEQEVTSVGPSELEGNSLGPAANLQPLAIVSSSLRQRPNRRVGRLLRGLDDRNGYRRVIGGIVGDLEATEDALHDLDPRTPQLEESSLQLTRHRVGVSIVLVRGVSRREHRLQTSDT